MCANINVAHEKGAVTKVCINAVTNVVKSVEFCRRCSVHLVIFHYIILVYYVQEVQQIENTNW